MKKQIDLFGNIISMEHATEKPVTKETKKPAENSLQPITPYTICKESTDITWIINTQI
jgi:hypothetical protein